MTHTIERTARPLALLIMLASTTACRDAYDALFLDPDKSTTARIEYVFTQGLIDADFPIHYGEWYWQVYNNVAAWAQVSGTVNDVNMMRPASDQWQNSWIAYYAKAAMDMREMRVLYDALPEDQKASRSEEHTSELQSQSNLVCRLLLEKKKREQRPAEHTLRRARLPAYTLISRQPCCARDSRAAVEVRFGLPRPTGRPPLPRYTPPVLC